MAIIGKIREKSILLVIIIGLALLAFILSDYKNMFGASEGEYGVGHVFGEKIDGKRYSILSGLYGEERAFQLIVDSLIMNKEYDALGISVSDKELNSYLLATDGFDVSSNQDIQNFFRDSIGNITPASIIAGRSQLKQQLTQLKKDKKQWGELKRGFTNQRKREKYIQVISQGIYTTTLEAENEFKAVNNKKEIEYIFKPYNSIPDSIIQYKEADLVKYFVKHRWDAKYQNPNPYKKVRFFAGTRNPSQKSGQAFKADVDTLKSKFELPENDTVYANLKSDLRMMAPTHQGQRQNSQTGQVENYYTGFGSCTFTNIPESYFPAENRIQELNNGAQPTPQESIAFRAFLFPDNLTNQFNEASIGDVIGPYRCGENMKNRYLNENNHFVLSKVIGKTYARIKARHILLKIEEGQDSSQIKAAADTYASQLMNSSDRDNLYNALKGNSADPIGEYDNLFELTLNFPESNRQQFYGKKIAEFCGNSEVGSVKVIESDLGYHVVEILAQEGTLPILTSIYKKFEPSETDLQDVQTDMSKKRFELAKKIKSLSNPVQIRAHFDSYIKELDNTYTSDEYSFQDSSPNSAIQGDKLLSEGTVRKFIETAYKDGAKVGTISVPVRDKNTYVIGMLYSTRNEGAPDYLEIKEELIKDYIKDKKAEMIMKSFKNKSIQDLSSTEGISIQTPTVSFNNMNNIDAEVIGALFSANGGKESDKLKPLKGSSGIYMIKIKKVANADSPANYKVDKEEIDRNTRNTIFRQNYLVNALYRKADIIDNREFLRLKIRY